MLRADARQHRLPARGGGAGAALRLGVRRLRDDRVARRRRASGRCATSTPSWRASTASTAEADAVVPRVYELSELLVDRLGVEDVGASLPAPRRLPPDVPLAADAGRRRRAAAAAARRARARAGRACRTRRSAAGSAGRSRSRTPTTSAAMLADKCAVPATPAARRSCSAADNSCLMHIGGGLSRGGRGRAARAPRRDPGFPGDAAMSCKAFPRAAARGARRRAAAPQPAQGDAHDPRQARAVVGEVPDWEELREAGRAIKQQTLAHLDEYLEQLEACGRRAPAGTCTGRATRRRRTRIVARDRARARRRRGGQGQVAGDRRDRPQRGARGRGDRRARDRPRRADRPARRRLAVAHPRAGDPPQPRRRSATSSGARSRAPTIGDDPRELAEAARLYLRERFLRAPVGISGANFGDRRDRHGRASSSPRATGACARRCPPVLDHGDGDREGPARASAISRSSCSCCRARRPASG